MVKVTFTLDDETVARIRRTAERMRKPQSQVVREAIADYSTTADSLSGIERRRMLQALDRLERTLPPRPARAVDAELRQVRAVRRQGGRRSPAR